MNLDKFTERSRGFIQAAQTIAQREDHARLGPEHLLKALLDDKEGLASNLIARSGGVPQRVLVLLHGLVDYLRVGFEMGPLEREAVVPHLRCELRNNTWSN